jgi:hypothetical protein
MAVTKEERIAQIVQSRFSTLKGDQEEIFDEVEVYHQMWQAAMTEAESYPWDYQLVDPVVFYLLRGIMGRLNPEHMKVNLEARNEASEPHRRTNQAVVNWELSEMNKTLVFYRFLFRGLMAGRAYLSSGWRYEPAVEVMAGEGRGRKVIMRDIVNRADAKNVRFQDVFIPNRNLPDIDEQPYVIERVTMRYGDMLDDNETAGKEIWKKKYLEKIRKNNLFVTQIDYGVDLPNNDEQMADLSKEEMFVRSQYVSLLKMQTKEGDVIWTPEKEDWVLNTEEGNPYWHGHYPYLSWTPFPEDDEFFSMGIVQPIADLQIAISSTLNQFLTNARKMGNPMWIAGSAANQTPDWQFVNRPDGIVRVAGDINQVRQIETKDNSRGLLEVRKELQTTFERATSMSSLYMSGVSGGSSPQINKTATGARVIDANIDINLQLLVALFGAQALSKLGEHFLELNAQFITDEQEVKITGEGGDIEYIRVHPEEITANFDVQVNPDTITKITPVVKQASLMNLKSLADKEGDVKLDKKPIWKALINAFPEMDNVGDILIDVEQMANEHIEEILGGGQPQVGLDDDHKGLLTVVQKHLLENAEGYDDETLARFLAYVDELRNYLQAANPQLFAPPPQPEMLPTDETALLESMAGQGMPAAPTQGLNVPINTDQL